MMTFADFDLPYELTRALDKLGLTEPTPVQAQAIPPALAGRDLLVSAATGSGKTAAFLLPMLARFLDSPDTPPEAGTRGLVIVPTRELARQIYDEFMKLGSYTRLRADVITGGAPTRHQTATLRKNPEILIATPGRLLEHLDRGEAELGDLEVLVLDEADRMLDMGFAPDVLRILTFCAQERQSMLLSATLHHRGLKPLTDELLRNPEVVTVDAARAIPNVIHQQVILADSPEHKQALTTWLLQNEQYDKAMVFTNTREGATRLGNALRAQGVRAGVVHGDIEQRERNRVLGLLRAGQINVLVATDVAARGLDVPGMQLVINFDVARSGDDHLHRTGRTGRAGERGLAVSLVGHTDWNNMASIERYLRLDVERRVIPGLKAKFEGPKKVKGAAKKAPRKPEKPAAPKPKQRHRDLKNKGKRRVPSQARNASPGDLPPPRKPREP
ncbi:MAG: DEAD/DEAH box helicase [Gammaproteobacteria bacterium]|nr:DEAD/DEAH box helicase [Gammaproteobacteria bacterium]